MPVAIAGALVTAEAYTFYRLYESAKDNWQDAQKARSLPVPLSPLQIEDAGDAPPLSARPTDTSEATPKVAPLPTDAELPKGEIVVRPKVQPQAQPQAEAAPETTLEQLPQPVTPDAPRYNQPPPQQQPPPLPKGVPEAIAGAAGAIGGKAAADAINASSETTLRSSEETRQKFKEMFGEARYNKAAREVEIVKSYRPELAEIPTEDLVAIRGYTEDDYYEINKALRTKDKEELKRLEPYIQCATSALNQLQSHQGTVYRGTDLSSSEVKRFRKGAVITDQGFLSSSSDRMEAFPGRTRFIIESVNGKEISSISENPDEKEVLFPPGTRFRVLDVEYDKSTYTHRIFMEEVPKGEK